MKKKLSLCIFGILIGVIGIVLVLSNENALVVHPKGLIARNILELIITNIVLMLIIIVPTYILLFSVIWKYCIKNDAKYDPNHSFGLIGQLLMWGIPSVIVTIMAFVTWEATHRLDPYKPIESEVKPLVVQVVALNWKWLFIYPEQGIATLNSLHIPERTPIHFQLTADHAPMNSFWIPQLSGQMYCMAGMINQEYLMADGIGKYRGQAVEINGDGYSSMTFQVESTAKADFDNWAAKIQTESSPLTNEVYMELVKPSVDQSVTHFSKVAPHLFHEIVHKYMYPTGPVL